MEKTGIGRRKEENRRVVTRWVECEAGRAEPGLSVCFLWYKGLFRHGLTWVTWMLKCWSISPGSSRSCSRLRLLLRWRPDWFLSFRSRLHSAGHQRDTAEGLRGRRDPPRKRWEVQSCVHQHRATRLPQVPPTVFFWPVCVELKRWRLNLTWHLYRLSQ